MFSLLNLGLPCGFLRIPLAYSAPPRTLNFEKSRTSTGINVARDTLVSAANFVSEGGSQEMSDSFNLLLDIHRRLDALFAQHQRALLRLDPKLALTRLELYERELLAHMRDEEELLLSVYAERVNPPFGGSVEIFLNEHRKMREYLALFKEALAELRDSEDLEGAVIWLLDSQTTFKRLHVHHDTRERKMLYPLLDEVTTAEERKLYFANLSARPNTFIHEDTPESKNAMAVENRGRQI